MNKEEILRKAKEFKIQFLRLQFTDIMGSIKNVEVPHSQFEKALDGQVLFDGSSIEGFSRIEESDMLLKPDLETFAVFPLDNVRGTVGRLICDVYHPDGQPFEGCPRLTLKKVVKEAAQMGFSMYAGPEAEFFLFHLDSDGNATTRTHDSASYFDLTPMDRGEDARRAIMNALECMGFEVEAAHHEVAPGQHEIDFQYADAVKTADNVSTFKFIVRRIALDFKLHATFMPKPIFGENGSGMHCHLSLFEGDKNAFDDPNGAHGLSKIALYFIGGILEHVRGFTAITNPLVNSYKRLVPGYEAPTNICWSERNRSPLVRVPARRGLGARAELRSPDPSCNPYLALAVILKAGLDGVRRTIEPGEPIQENIFELAAEDKVTRNIHALPRNLGYAIDCLEKDEVILDALGSHIANHFIKAKRLEWQEYIARVHPWEVERYLSYY